MNAPGLHTTSRALTEREVAGLLGLSVATLRAWRHRGQGPRYLRLGRAVRYLPADLETFVRASVVEGGAEHSSHRRGGSEEAHP